jgi:enoyl-CoA hydratase/carnithine racemase
LKHFQDSHLRPYEDQLAISLLSMEILHNLADESESAFLRLEPEMRKAESEPVVVARTESWLAIVTLNRESVRNAISRKMAQLLSKCLDELALNPELRALILTGAGSKAFSGGADLKERHRMTPRQRQIHTAEIRQAADRLATFPVPVVAAINGYALAGGAELAIACDLRVAGESAIIGFPEVRLGIFPGAGAVERLPRIVGASKARHLLFSGRQIESDQALAIGLVDSVVPDDYVFAETTRLCRDIASQSPSAVRALKKAILATETELSDEAARLVEAIRAELDSSGDYNQGLEAFAEGKLPNWLEEQH